MADQFSTEALQECIGAVADDLGWEAVNRNPQLIESARAELAQLSQAVEAATAPLHRIIQMQNAERIAINEENQRNYNDLVARQETIVEAAARLLDKALHAASDALIPEGTCANADQEEGYSDGVCCTLNLLWKSVGDIRALQTEPMTIALEKRDRLIESATIMKLRKLFSESDLHGHYNLIQNAFPEDGPAPLDMPAGLAARYQPQPPEGHNRPCYYCGEPCNALAGNPGKWPLAFPHRDEPGVVKWQHVGCVVARLTENQPVGIAEAVKAVEEAAEEVAYREGYHDGTNGRSFSASHSEGALDRYVASKVREAKIAAYERCASIVKPTLFNLVTHNLRIFYDTFMEWAEAERKESNASE